MLWRWQRLQGREASVTSQHFACGYHTPSRRRMQESQENHQKYGIEILTGVEHAKELDW